MNVSRIKSALLVTILAAVIGVVASAQPSAGSGQGPSTGSGQGPSASSGQGGAPQGQAAPLQNLQVLPKDMTRQQITQKMRGMAAALGVMCDHCHTGGQQDRAKDDNPKKAIARQMLKMTAAINNDLLKGVGEPAAAGAEKVSCFTCHRGAIKPLTAPAGGGGQ